jgi:hypothetical protein
MENGIKLENVIKRGVNSSVSRIQSIPVYYKSDWSTLQAGYENGRRLVCQWQPLDSTFRTGINES